MSKQVKAVKAALWQPVSNKQAEIIKGGYIHIHSYCSRTKKMMFPQAR